MKDNKNVKSFGEFNENLNISDVSDSYSKKNKFMDGDVIEVIEGGYKGHLFRVVNVDRDSHITLELIKCKMINVYGDMTSSDTIYNFDNLCADVLLREGEFDLDFLVKNFYIKKK